jgi:hypothetical protein
VGLKEVSYDVRFFFFFLWGRKSGEICALFGTAVLNMMNRQKRKKKKEKEK